MGVEKRWFCYSLLGPSGCGKTTLLKCIVGQHKPQAGSIRVFGRIPGSTGFFIPGRGVGYMPQDLALYMEMTIEEILTYYGSLYGMKMKTINERIFFLIRLLELPDKNKLIQQLSGGQQRRVSFAIALIHKPPLLILDEPTVGVDPLLRKAIWDHLVSLARNSRLTVIITTHYTEEARQADTVGLMRNGHLLVEKNPDHLIKQYGLFTLEDVFLKLCQKDSNEDKYQDTNVDVIITDKNLDPESLPTNGHVSEERITDESYTNSTTFTDTTNGTLDTHNGSTLHDNTTALLPLPPLLTEFDCNFSPTHSWMRLFFLTRKNFLRFKRNIFLFLFILGIPAIQVTVIYLCVSSDPFDLPVAVANEDKGLNKFGEKFLLSMTDLAIHTKLFDNFTLAFESLKNGESWAAVHISSDFSTCLVDRFLDGINSSNDTVWCSTISITLDVSNYIIAGTLRRSLWDSYEAFIKQMLISLGANPLLGQFPMQIEDYTVSSKPASFVEFVAPAIILCIAYVMSMGLTHICIIGERKHDLMGRAIVAGATTTEILLSFFFELLLVLILQLVLMLGATFLVFNFSCNGPVFWFIIAATLAGMCGMTYGFLISVLTDDENAAAMLTFGTFFPVIFLGGALWPVEAMPHYLRYVTYFLPLTRIFETGRSIMGRGWNITENYTWDGYLTCSFWIVLYMTLSIILLKIRK